MISLAFAGCEPTRDPYAEHLLEQRNKAIKQLEQRAARDKSLDILCWDLTEHINKPNTIKKWATSQQGLDLLAFSGPNLSKLKQAADMAEVINSLERGWPVVTSTNEMTQEPQGLTDEPAPGSDISQYYVMNANGYRFDGVLADPIEKWTPEKDEPGRVDPPSILHLQVRYTPHEVILVYLTHCDQVSDRQLTMLSHWIDEQSVPVIVFGQFDSSRLKNASLVTIDPARLAVSKSIESWQFSIEELKSPLGGSEPPFMIRCKEMTSTSSSS